MLNQRAQPSKPSHTSATEAMVLTRMSGLARRPISLTLPGLLITGGREESKSNKGFLSWAVIFESHLGDSDYIQLCPLCLKVTLGMVRVLVPSHSRAVLSLLQSNFYTSLPCDQQNAKGQSDIHRP